MDNPSLFDDMEEKWYTIEELAELTGYKTAHSIQSNPNTLKVLNQFSNSKDVKMGGYHNTQKMYSENVLKALQQYLIKNGTSNAMKNKKDVQQNIVHAVSKLTYDSTVEQIKSELVGKYEMLSDVTKEMIARDIKINMQSEAIKEQKAILNRIENGGGYYSNSQAVKALQLPYGRNTFIDMLKDMGIYMQSGEPYQEQVRAGHFVMKNKLCTDNVNRPVSLITGKGLVYLAKKFNTDLDRSVRADR